MDIPNAAKLYIVAVVIVAGLLTAEFLTPLQTVPLPSLITPFLILSFVLFLAEVYEVELMYKRALSTGTAVCLAGILLGGPKLGISVAVLGTIAAEFVLRWGWLKTSITSFLWRVGFNSAQLTLATAGSALLFSSLGGIPLLTAHVESVSILGQILPSIIAFIAFQFLNLFLVAGIITITSHTSIWYHLKFDIKHLAVQVLSLGVLGILMAVTYAQSPWNLLLVLIPMGLVHVSLRNYMKLRHEAKQTFESMADMLHARDPYTFEHSDDVADLSEEIARQMGLHEDEIEQVRSGALIHDVGKIGIPDSILKKPGKLNDEEWEIMKTHPDIGADLIKDLEMYAGVVDLVRHEHEHWDGNGYPKGLQGDEIPLGARIIAVADAYNALITDRPYRNAHDHESAVDIIKAESGTHFDPTVVDAFLTLMAADRRSGGSQAGNAPPTSDASHSSN